MQLITQLSMHRLRKSPHYWGPHLQWIYHANKSIYRNIFNRSMYFFSFDLIFYLLQIQQQHSYKSGLRAAISNSAHKSIPNFITLLFVASDLPLIPLLQNQLTETYTNVCKYSCRCRVCAEISRRHTHINARIKDIVPKYWSLRSNS